MVDAHVHLEKGKYCVEWIQEFIRYSLVRDIDEIYFLEHTHIFKNCRLWCNRSLLGQGRRKQPVHHFCLAGISREGNRKKNIETLEQDEYFLKAKRIEIPASITGTPFYRKMGYDYKNGICVPDEEGLLRLEKYR